jgi:hypothetical protein
MAAYFFDEPLELGQTGYYDESLGDFYFDPDQIDRFYLPDESLRYRGPVAVITGPNCGSACEFFTYAMTQQDRANVVAHYPTAGLGGSQNLFLMPEFEYLQISIGRPVDMEGNLIIEGVGVPPTVRVPVTEETLFAEGDPLLETAIAVVTGAEALPYGATPFEGSPIAQPARPAEAEAPTEEAAPTPTEEAVEEPTPAATPEPAEEATPAPTEEAAEEPMPAVTPEPTEEAAVGATVTIVSGGSRVIVRSQPGAMGSIIGLVNDGETYTLLERSADGAWVKIDFGERGGWINADFVRINE